jgi:hypothetical protein
VPDSPEEIRHPNGDIEHPNVRREATDAKFWPILYLLIAAAAIGLVIHLLVWAFLAGWRDHEAAVKRSPYPLATRPSDDPRVLPPLPPGEPRLEQIDRTAGVERPNINERFTNKEEVLNSSDLTEVDGFVRIPIGVAMKRLENKLPARAEPPADKAWRADGLIDSGESNSGREFRRRPR